MAEDIVMRGTNGVLYRIPAQIAAQHALNKAEAQKLFAASKSSVTQERAGHVPDFNVLLQMEYL